MSIIVKINTILDQIKKTELDYHRSPGSVRLLAISKMHDITALKQAIQAGQRSFAESYVQEALGKMAALADQPIEWHFIGRIQSNKAKIIAQHFDWVHSVDHINIARRLNHARPDHFLPLKVCLQVNVDCEETKRGILLSELADQAAQVIQLPRLILQGLMAIPKPKDSFNKQRMSFRLLHEALKQLNQQGFALSTLSMGMSDDFVAAIAEGATIVRLGKAIFGPRRTIYP